MNVIKLITRALTRLNARSVYSKRARQARVRARQDHWPAIEGIQGEFYQGVSNIPDMQAFFAQADPMPDISNGIPERVHGRCYVCQRDVDFTVDTELIRQSNNWRETMKCPDCGLINRWRSSFHLFEALLEPVEQDDIYLTEAVTPLFNAIAERYPQCVGSEYAPDVPLGTDIELPCGPTRIEDVTRLTFPDGSFEAVLSFDVLEHVPDFKSALREFYRVLAPGGQALISVPFTFVDQTTTRAELDSEGNTKHLLEPSYHGDPLSDDGVLCYYEFGMDMLQEIRKAGFQDAFLVCYTSHKWAYYDQHVMFVGRKTS